MKRFCSIVILLSSASAATAADLPAPKTAAPVDAKAATDIASYGIGQQIAGQVQIRRN